jgi:hypothetical protein
MLGNAADCNTINTMESRGALSRHTPSQQVYPELPVQRSLDSRKLQGIQVMQGSETMQLVNIAQNDQRQQQQQVTAGSQSADPYYCDEDIGEAEE